MKKISCDFYIENIGYPLNRIYHEKLFFEGESHDFAEIVFVKSGSAEITENENVYVLNSGDIIFHAPSEFHTIKTIGSSSLHLFNLSAIFKGKLPDGMYDGVFSLTDEDQADFLDFFRLAEKYIATENPPAFSGQELTHRLLSFILKITNKNALSDSFSSDPGAEAYGKIVKTMTENIYSNLSLEEIADKNHISISYVKKLFYRYAGVSPKKYYSHLKLQEIIHLLSLGISKSEIAEKMGFSSPAYFTNYCKKHLGTTPTQYQKEKI